MKIQTKRYEVQNKVFKSVINFYWNIESNIETTVNHKLLPITNTDLILNFSSPIEYIINDDIVLSPDFHFVTIKNQSYSIKQIGKINVFGISFLPHGLYHVLQKPMSTFNNKIVDIQNYNLELIQCMQTQDFYNCSTENRVKLTEDALLNDINFNCIDNLTMEIINDFYASCNEIKITDFCFLNKISIKQFERIFLKIVGITPKQYQGLSRYQKAANSIIYDKKQGKLSELAHNLNYFDQTHFNKDFIKYSGYNPTTFSQTKPTVKQNSELI